MKKNFLNLVLVFVIGLSMVQVRLVSADAAPPEAPPGVTLLPGESVTEVRMVSETVVLTVSANPSDPKRAIAKTEASFTMRNLGASEETMAVRFPLSFFNGNSDGYGGFPEIDSIAVRVDGKNVSTRREIQPFTASETSYPERDELPWAVFDVTFPPGQNVLLEVAYTVNGYGYYPYEVFSYVLETGAGWNGTIGNAEIIVRLPYAASEQNLDLSGEAGHGESSYDSEISGNEIRWTFTDFEPTYLDNIRIVIVTPSLWQNVLNEKEIVAKNPNDGEAWGRLAKAYKEVARMPKGYLRADRGGQELYALSKAAYEKCLMLLPDDSLWHYGYADLLWSHYYFGVYWAGVEDEGGLLTTILTELQTALDLDPNNQQAKDLLQEISWQMPEAVQFDGDTIHFPGLTATPIPPTRFPTETPPATPAPVSTTPAESTPQATPAAPTESLSAPTDAPAETNPMCGSSARIVPVLAGVFWMTRRRR